MSKYRTTEQICGGKKLRKQYGVGVGRIIPEGTVMDLTPSQVKALEPWIEKVDEKTPNTALADQAAQLKATAKGEHGKKADKK